MIFFIILPLGNADSGYGLVAMRGGEMCLKKIGIPLKGHCLRCVITESSSKGRLVSSDKGEAAPWQGGDSWECTFSDHQNLFKCSHSKSQGLLHPQYPSHKRLGQM